MVAIDISRQAVCMKAEQRHLKSMGKRLQRIRKEKGVTQEALAEAVGVHSTYISMVERGIRNPTFKTLDKIAHVLKVDIRELF